MILARLYETNGIRRSLSWLKAQWKRLRLSRRPLNSTPTTIVKNCIAKEIRTSNSQLGYRAMWKLLRDKYHLIVKRDTVMSVMRHIDPLGVELRRSRKLARRVYLSKGPNYCWHADGYDKLAPFYIFIHGCIDGFSRRIMWLNVSSTNHNSGVILRYYLNCVEKTEGCPTVIRLDRGTENVKMAAVQYAFRENHLDELSGEKSFRFGTSPANIRIESWWSQLRRHKTGWWIHVFKEMEQLGLFDRVYDTHRKCLALVFVPILERELKEFVHYWNSHHIRPSRHGDCLGGIPNDLYEMPLHYGCQNYLKAVDSIIWTAALRQTEDPPPFFSQAFYCRCQQLVSSYFGWDINHDINISNALDVYLYLIENV